MRDELENQEAFRLVGAVSPKMKIINTIIDFVLILLIVPFAVQFWMGIYFENDLLLFLIVFSVVLIFNILFVFVVEKILKYIRIIAFSLVALFLVVSLFSSTVTVNQETLKSLSDVLNFFSAMFLIGLLINFIKSDLPVIFRGKSE